MCVKNSKIRIENVRRSLRRFIFEKVLNDAMRTAIKMPIFCSNFFGVKRAAGKILAAISHWLCWFHQKNLSLV